MLSLCLRQAEHCTASVTLAIYMRFAVAEFVFAKLEESAEFLVLAATSRDVA